MIVKRCLFYLCEYVLVLISADLCAGEAAALYMTPSGKVVTGCAGR